MNSSRSSTPDLGYYKLPPIITTEADREFLNEVNAFVDLELGKINHLKEEERYLIFKTVFNKVIEHVTAYKPVLVQIKREYEETIETIKKGQREAIFLQEKLKAMASEPSTLRNYRKRGDELEERIAIIRKKNEQIQQEIDQVRLKKEEKEKRPKSAETPERKLKKDSRLIPGLSIEESTDMKILHKKYETLDRQLKELSLSLRARFLPKSHKMQLKESLDNKVTYRDQLLWQKEVYKIRGQKLKIALEAAQAYNQMKPPHQTVGDAVTIAFQQASGLLKAEREKTEGDQADNAQEATFEDDDPNKEKEAEMMLEYIEKFNELFEDGLYEEAAVHAANSPKGILRTQATLAKFRDVKVKSKSRSPLLAFCDSIMSSVRAAGSKPNEALSMDCMEACLNENQLDLAYHWLSQDRLTQSVGLGDIISKHCSCPLPCKCGCQALAQSVFTKLKCHQKVVLTMFKQGKIQGALQYGKMRQCINDENVAELLKEACDQSFVNGLMEGDLNGNKILADLNLGALLLILVEQSQVSCAANLIQNLHQPAQHDGDQASTSPLSLQSAVMSDSLTSPEQWMAINEALSSAGHHDTMYQLLAMTFVVDVLQKAWKVAEDMKEVPLDYEFPIADEIADENEKVGESSGEEESYGDNEKDSSIGMSSRSRDTVSMDHSSRETSPEATRHKLGTKESALRKKANGKRNERQDTASSPDTTPRKSPVKKRSVRISRNKAVTIGTKHEEDSDEGLVVEEYKRQSRVSFSPSKKKSPAKESRVKFQGNEESEDEKCEPEKRMKSKEVSFEIEEDNNIPEAGKTTVSPEDENSDSKTKTELITGQLIDFQSEMRPATETKESKDEGSENTGDEENAKKADGDHMERNQAEGTAALNERSATEDKINEVAIDQIEQANVELDVQAKEKVNTEEI